MPSERIKRRKPKTPWDDGGWFSVYRHDKHGAFIVCPKCGEVTEIEAEFIGDNGSISPKVIFRCQDFPAGAILEEWTE